MARFSNAALSFAAGMALVIAVFAAGEFHQTVAAAPQPKATLSRDVDNPANYPYMGGFDVSGQFPTVPTATPDGKLVKRAVIEYVSGTCASVLPATIYEADFGVTVGSQSTYYSFVPVQTIVAGGTNPQYAFGQAVRFYADPGTSLMGGIGISSGPVSPSNNCSLVFSGHLVTE
jgi:hypothetical protein